MNQRDGFQDALDDWLDDGNVSDGQDARVPDDMAQHAAESLVVHGLLTDMGRPKEVSLAFLRLDENGEELTPSRKGTTFRRSLAAAMLVVAACIVVMLFIHGPSHVDAAIVSLEKVIAASRQALDRTYVIHVVEEYPKDKRPRNLPPERWQREPKENIDKAILHVRGADKYVFSRSLGDGRKRITGCDGNESWAFREDGPVHVSSDLQRFRGGLPGHQQDFPFVNIHANLEQLRDGYDLELLPEDGQKVGDRSVSRLVGSRKSPDVRGPKRVEIWFQTSTGTVQRMLLDGLPRGKGGPKSVMLELTSEDDLGPDFFKHTSHHEADRRVKYE